MYYKTVFSSIKLVLLVCLPDIGRSYCVRTQRMLNQCLESLVQKVQSGVVINFEKTGPDPLPVGEGKVDNLFLTLECYIGE